MGNQSVVVPADTKIKLSDYQTDYKGDYRDKLDARKDLAQNLAKLTELQELLYACKEHGLLIVLQGRDAAGKDGTIRHVMDAFNPQGCRVANFKVPTAEELSHDFLWRIHKQVPARGEIVIFNRSHYEDVLVVRVDELVPKKVWKARYEHINNFERMLAESGTIILKFFLDVSKDEQKQRFQERLDDPTKNWKFSLGDLKVREKWNEYDEAYEDALTHCNTPWAPWHVVPSDRKWYRNLVVSQVLVEKLQSLKMKYPDLSKELKNVKID